MIRLVRPGEGMEEDVMAFRREFLEAGEKEINGGRMLHHFDDYKEWLHYVRKSQKPENAVTGVRASLYFALEEDEGRLVGCIELRHELNRELEVLGGNIGYSVAPRDRRKGYGTRMLQLVAEKAKVIGIDVLLLTCDTKNIASIRTITKCGGVLEKEEKIRRRGKETSVRYYRIQV
ncbi:MAG: GNAT family N-acetyltransferase [Coprococcus sp.]|nr:GNAT family N-acetyltransferase [Coprococcus sp.]